jgi:hypothetical protein
MRDGLHRPCKPWPATVEPAARRPAAAWRAAPFCFPLQLLQLLLDQPARHLGVAAALDHHLAQELVVVIAVAGLFVVVPDLDLAAGPVWSRPPPAHGSSRSVRERFR